MLSNPKVAKTFGWSVGVIGVLTASGAFGKYTPVATSVISLLSALGIHAASNTSK